jgi:hypothetical protein
LWSSYPNIWQIISPDISWFNDKSSCMVCFCFNYHPPDHSEHCVMNILRSNYDLHHHPEYDVITFGWMLVLIFVLPGKVGVRRLVGILMYVVCVLLRKQCIWDD